MDAFIPETSLSLGGKKRKKKENIVNMA